MKKTVVLIACLCTLATCVHRLVSASDFSFKKAVAESSALPVLGPPPVRHSLVGGPQIVAPWLGYCKHMGWRMEDNDCLLPGAKRENEFRLWRKIPSGGYTWQKSEEGRKAIAEAEPIQARAREQVEQKYQRELADYERQKATLEAERASRKTTAPVASQGRQ